MLQTGLNSIRINASTQLENKIVKINGYTVDSRYLEVQGTLWNTSRYPYLDISDFQNEETIIRTTTFNKYIYHMTIKLFSEITHVIKII